MAVASLPMYDLPELRAATDAWWQGLAHAFRREGIADVPDSLDGRTSYQEIWSRPDLLFSQTCGYPLMRALAGRVTLVATPCYRAEGCDGPNYCSVVVVATDSTARTIADLRDTRCAVNGLDSQSGYNALRALVAPHAERGRFFGSVAVTGGHRASIARVATGEADIAAVDCVSYALLARHRPQALTGVRVLCRTAPAPSLPYITRVGADADLLRRLRAGLERAFADPGLAEARAALLLDGAAVLPLAAYDRIDELEQAAIAAGYPQIA
ncbi:MAG TPA: PhnD/SsuA/transferrin family substrate-binding protein [Candidatus Acidoferrum sp.]|nr:PhnD/SsuA/transferrin family substrate-binding protein [Candidatus Acidoferrum sp.]